MTSDCQQFNPTDPTAILVKNIAEAIAQTPHIEDTEKAKKIYADLDLILRNITADMSGTTMYEQQTLGVFENPTVTYRDSHKTRKLFDEE